MRIVLCSAVEAQSRKASRYIMAPERFQVQDVETVVVEGSSNTHELKRQLDSSWSCDCAFFRWSGQECAHILAWQHLHKYGPIHLRYAIEPLPVAPQLLA